MSIKESVIAYAAEAEQAGMNPKNNLISAEMPHGMGAAADTLNNAELIEKGKNDDD